MGSQVGDLARTLANTPAPPKAEKAEKRSPLAVLLALFGAPIFSLPEYTKDYRDEKTGEISRKLALVAFPIAGIIGLYGSIYVRFRQDKDGPFEEYTLSFGRGTFGNCPGVTAPAAAEGKLVFESWKESVLAEYDKWAATLDNAQPVKRTMAAKLVKRSKTA